jgi:hypothetical protein
VSRERDTQRQRVYDAENAAGINPWVQTIPNADLQAWVDSVLDRRAIRSRWGVRQVRVELTHGRGAYARGSGLIRASRGARNEYVLLHEIAHTLTSGRGYAAHGPEFCGVLLFLVKTVMGREAHAALLAQMRARKVKRSNVAIPAVRKDVPEPKAKRERQERAAMKEKAMRDLRWLVTNHGLSWAAIERVARQERLTAAARKRATR